MDEDNLQALGANGIVGVGLYPQDCGPACASGTPSDVYFTCIPSGNCQPVLVPVAQHVVNPGRSAAIHQVMTVYRHRSNCGSILLCWAGGAALSGTDGKARGKCVPKAASLLALGTPNPAKLHLLWKNAMNLIRLLLVDDHEIARRGIRSALSANPDIVVVGETADGEEAVRRAGELHPNIVLLDISLPGMSGIDAARSIRNVSPESRIIFVSQHDSLRIAQDALAVGALGYVVKSDAGRDLLVAIQAAQEGRTFVSRTLVACGWAIQKTP